MYLNKIFIAGNLTKAPELKSLPNGTKVTTFSVATNEVYKDSAGVKKEKVEFHNIVVFGRVAETSAQYLQKGQNVLIEGKIQTRSWEDKTTGEKKYRTEILASAVQFGQKPQGTGSSPQDEKPSVEGKGYSGNDLDTIDYGDSVNPDDIPF